MNRTQFLLLVLVAHQNVTCCVQVEVEEDHDSQERPAVTNPPKKTGGPFDTIGLKRCDVNKAFTEVDKHDCNDHTEPNKRMACWLSKDEQGRVTQEEAIRGMADALKEKNKRHPTLVTLTGFWYSSRTHSVAVGRVTPLGQDPWIEVGLPFGYGADHRLIAHIKATEKPALVYSLHGLKGKHPPNPIAEFYATDGTPGARIMYVQDGESQVLAKAQACSDFDRLPEGLRRRKHISVIMRGAGICTDPDKTKDFDKFIGEYEEIEDPGTKQKYYKPKWECNLQEKKCGGEDWPKQEVRAQLEKYLPFLA